jgi:hypothetical protein
VATGIRTKVQRKNKMFVREQEKKIFRLILPFVQAMEDVRFTALEQKDFMIQKAVCDALNPNIFENVRWRYHQEDI